MLAVKSALAEKDALGAVIYDEIDTGVSGLAAGRIGEMLHKTAGGRQVICITHTAQIAAQADTHLLIEKTVHDGRTYTQIRALDIPGRQQELARMISDAYRAGKCAGNAAHAQCLTSVCPAGILNIVTCKEGNKYPCGTLAKRASGW